MALVNKLAPLKRNAMAAPSKAADEEPSQQREAGSGFSSEDAPQGVGGGGVARPRLIQYREEEAICFEVAQPLEELSSGHSRTRLRPVEVRLRGVVCGSSLPRCRGAEAAETAAWSVPVCLRD